MLFDFIGQHIGELLTAFTTIVSLWLIHKYRQEKLKNENNQTSNTNAIDGFRKLTTDIQAQLDRSIQTQKAHDQERDEWFDQRAMFNDKCAKFQEDIYRLDDVVEDLTRDKTRLLELEKSFDLEKDQYKHDRDNWNAERVQLQMTVAKLEGFIESQAKAHNSELERINQRMIQSEQMARDELTTSKAIIENLKSQIAQLEEKIKNLTDELAKYETKADAIIATEAAIVVSTGGVDGKN